MTPKLVFKISKSLHKGWIIDITKRAINFPDTVQLYLVYVCTISQNPGHSGCSLHTFIKIKVK